MGGEPLLFLPFFDFGNQDEKFFVAVSRSKSEKKKDASFFPLVFSHFFFSSFFAALSLTLSLSLVRVHTRISPLTLVL